MKNYLAGFLSALLILTACAAGSKRYQKPERNMQDKIWSACEDSWMPEGVSPIGKKCNRVCVKRTKSGKCKDNIFKTNIKNYCKEEDFKWFRAGSFISVDEDQFF